MNPYFAGYAARMTGGRESINRCPTDWCKEWQDQWCEGWNDANADYDGRKA